MGIYFYNIFFTLQNALQNTQFLYNRIMSWNSFFFCSVASTFPAHAYLQSKMLKDYNELRSSHSLIDFRTLNPQQNKSSIIKRYQENQSQRLVGNVCVFLLRECICHGHSFGAMKYPNAPDLEEWRRFGGWVLAVGGRLMSSEQFYRKNIGSLGL